MSGCMSVSARASARASENTRGMSMNMPQQFHRMKDRTNLESRHRTRLATWRAEHMLRCTVLYCAVLYISTALAWTNDMDMGNGTVQYCTIVLYRIASYRIASHHITCMCVLLSSAVRQSLTCSSLFPWICSSPPRHRSRTAVFFFSAYLLNLA